MRSRTLGIQAGILFAALAGQGMIRRAENQEPEPAAEPEPAPMVTPVVQQAMTRQQRRHAARKAAKRNKP